MDFQFYPTPQHLALKLWSKFQNPHKLVLEPNAGKGDLITAYTKGFDEVPDDVYALNCPNPECFRMRGWRMKGAVNWNACEINLEMHPILTSLGAQIVGHDFLKMQSAAQYSHILMNPPFQDGVHHLLHAWNIAYGAEIVCLLNAQTVRNPHTTERMRLVQLIEQYGSVEYLPDQFLGEGVERETAVEVAVVYLKKVPQTVLNMDEILASLKCAGEDHVTMESASTLNALALPATFIDRVVEDYEVARDAALQVAQAQAVSAVAVARLGFTFDEMQSKGLDAKDRPLKVDPGEVIRQSIDAAHNDLRNRAWGQVLRSTKVLDKLSNSGRKNVESQFESISKLEFTRSNVHGFFAGLLQSMGEVNSQMLLDLFDMIMGRDTDNACFYRSWKSNEKHKQFGMRIKRTRFILPLAQFDTTVSSRPDWETKMVLSDMDKVFSMLDNRRAEERGTGLVELVEDQGLYARLVAGERLDTEYFSVRLYKGRGTYHFFPRNGDVIERLNRFVGRLRQWLPPDMETASSDFIKQYEEAEKLTPDYLDEIGNVKTSYRMIHPVYLLLNALKGDKKGSEETSLVCDAIHKVQMVRGINAEHAIEGPDESKAPINQLSLAM